ncbi:DUF192 domain-containing protein [Aquimarina brevivitae]|uniref:DUF192 domain-containing protein n=1 Tax=Aquimarina brevivitae TaxID=323412 RepID=A0A4Q7NY78_9FLAO|nr:DUF192 domain-containing protein [Aquimarina brevivitae]RZS91908.1 hypothetical protein EV197_3012 [Aquimarina brevivitae]
MHTIKTPIVLLGLSLFFYACKNDSKSDKNLTQEVNFTKEGEATLFRVNDSSTTKITQLEIEIADNEYEIQTGLMYRKTMEPNRGMLFVFEEDAPRSFYMKNTQIALDLIFLNSDHKVVSIQKNAAPMNEKSLLSEGPARYVLEVNAGLSEQWNLQKGDSVAFKKIK